MALAFFSALCSRQSGIDFIFRFLRNLDDLAPDGFHFLVVLWGEYFQCDGALVRIRERGIDGFGNRAVGERQLFATVFRCDDQTAAIGAAGAGEAARDFTAALLDFMVYGDGFVVIRCEGHCLQISYVVSGPVHARVLHAPPCPLPWSAIGKVEIGKCPAANDQHDGDHDHDHVFLHSQVPRSLTSKYFLLYHI